MADDTKQIFPWGLHPLDDWIKDEFDRRTREYDANPTKNPTNENPYSGPKTAWIRVFSNGKSSLADKLEGFVMGGTEGFDESYGFGKDGKITLGVDAYGKPHEIRASNDESTLGNPDFSHRPPPSIVSIETEFSGGSNSGFGALCRKTKISWKCFSLSQLEYLTPYFLTPRITCLVEWGWNHYDTTSLVDLTDIDWLYGIFEGKPKYTSDWVEESSGNYDLAMGFITDFEYTVNEFGGYDCSTTITNANYLIGGQSYKDEKDSKKDETKESGSLQIKDFTEFVFDDMDNLFIQPNTKKTVQKGGTGGYKPAQGGTNFAAWKNANPTETVASNVQDESAIKISTKFRVFKNDDDTWLRMDLIVDIINNFFRKEFLSTASDTQTVSSAGTLDITKVPVCAHPGLKSTSKNFIIPNKFAPRFVTFESGTLKTKSLIDAKTPRGNYYSLFPNIKQLMISNKFDQTYDDLLEALHTKNANANSFPMYNDYTDNGANNSPKAGYWGYLSDIYVSVEYFKSLVKKNDTVLKLVEELGKGISDAMCNTSQLKPVPNTVGSSDYTIMDINFNSINTTKDAENLLKINLGSLSSAFMKSANFSVKLSGEMANQMVMQSASGKDLPEGYGTANYDPKTMRVSKFSVGDRMFDRGVIPPKQVVKSNNSEDGAKAKYKRMFNEQNKSFYVYTVDVQNTKSTYVLTETDSSFLKSIILDSKDKKAVYTNNNIMPGTKFTMELLGIGGITFLSQFTLAHVPSSYSYEQCVWQVSQVTQKVENKVWITSVTAEARPLSSVQ
jgi:hypothetical protein